MAGNRGFISPFVCRCVACKLHENTIARTADELEHYSTYNRLIRTL